MRSYSYKPPDHRPDGALVAVLREKPASTYSYARATLTFQYLDPSGEQLHSPYGDDPVGTILAEAFIDNDGTIYGNKLAAEMAGHLTLAEIEDTARLMRLVTTRLTAMSREWGSPESHGTFCLRLCKALGIVTVIWPSFRPPDPTHTRLEVQSLPYYISRCFEQLKGDKVHAWQL